MAELRTSSQIYPELQKLLLNVMARRPTPFLRNCRMQAVPVQRMTSFTAYPQKRLTGQHPLAESREALVTDTHARQCLQLHTHGDLEPALGSAVGIKLIENLFAGHCSHYIPMCS